MKHKLMLQKICHADELANINPNLFKDDKALLSHLLDNQIGMVLDYRFEPPKDVSEFIQNRINKLSLKPIQLKFDQMEQDFEKDENDNFVDFMFRDFDKQIKKSGAKIVLLETYSDHYILFIVDKKHAKNLKNIKSDFWQFNDLTNKPNAKLYVIYCPNCQMINVWELPFNEPTPTEGYCTDCNTPLWDNNGNPCEGVDVEIDEVYLPKYN